MSNLGEIDIDSKTKVCKVCGNRKPFVYIVAVGRIQHKIMLFHYRVVERIQLTMLSLPVIDAIRAKETNLHQRFNGHCWYDWN